MACVGLQWHWQRLPLVLWWLPSLTLSAQALQHTHSLAPELCALRGLCQVPLLDMLRYTSLGAGASWVAEYGDPADPAMRQLLAEYSPYHNVDRTQTYPPAFFIASTLDDRVHPGHARKMVAKMLAMDKSAYYLESSGEAHFWCVHVPAFSASAPPFIPLYHVCWSVCRCGFMVPPDTMSWIWLALKHCWARQGADACWAEAAEVWKWWATHTPTPTPTQHNTPHTRTHTAQAHIRTA